MSRLRLMDKVLEAETVERKLASTVVEELTEILENADGPDPAMDLEPDGAYWHYSVPMAGVRYYGFPQRPSSEK